MDRRTDGRTTMIHRTFPVGGPGKFFVTEKFSTSNHMFRRTIWDKLPKCNFETFENFKIFKNHQGDLSPVPQNHPNQTCGYWLITPNQQTLCIGTNTF